MGEVASTIQGKNVGVTKRGEKIGVCCMSQMMTDLYYGISFATEINRSMADSCLVIIFGSINVSV